ncbi:MAG: hypothetical protein KDA37_08245 [Planctomycetales bacterium]|nr:hypothetical protein [Planctomycetales bacterium]
MYSASDQPGARSRPHDAILWLLRLTSAYLALSIVTFPFVNVWWVGELAPLAALQFPKLSFAGWLRTSVVMPLISRLGLSRGSFSPDYITAGPYALVLAYVIPLAGILVVLLASRRLQKVHLVWLAVVAVAAVIDFFVVQLLSSRGLSLY